MQCDDMDLCTEFDVCSEGACQGTPKVCDDELWCTGEESCSAESGECIVKNIPVIDDGVECTEDQCDEENEQVLNTPDNTLCDDLNECTTNLCVPLTGCAYDSLENGTECNGGQGWHCEEGVCTCDTDCSNRQCGDDGCGGSCGECIQGQSCNGEYGVCVPKDWVVVTAGSFFMGSDDSDPCAAADESPQHEVSLTRDLLVSDHEVTQSEWLAALPVGTGNPSYHGPDGFLSGACMQSGCPVEMVSWIEAIHYCNKLSEKENLPICYAVDGCMGEASIGHTCLGAETTCQTGYDCFAIQFKGAGCLGYRLPTEAEWEYLARGSTSKPLAAPDFAGGSALQEGQCGPDCVELSYLSDYAQYCQYGGQFPKLTGQRDDNGFGLHDMAGNVREWTFDFYDADFYETSSAEDPVSSQSPPAERTIRGGSYLDSQAMMRSAWRSSQGYRTKSRDLGFRVVRSLPSAK